MNDAESPADAPAALEGTLAAWDEQLAGLERQAAQVLRAARRLRKAAQEGAVATFPSTVAELHDNAAKLQATVSQSATAPDIDLAATFASGAFLDELSRAATTAGVTLVQRDGRISVYPLALRLEPRSQAVRIGRKLERRVRPLAAE